MRKSLIAQSVAALIGGVVAAGAANAGVVWPAGANDQDINPAGGVQTNVSPATNFVVNTDGVGHVLIVPYYTTQNGNDTYVNITNTDTYHAKLVKVRFRAAANSDDVFDYTALMSPGDTQAIAITKGADGLPKLVTADKSCTLPANIQQSFVTTRLDSALSAAEKAAQSSEGYVEILTMADIPPTIAFSSTDSSTLTLFNSLKHVSGVPRDCNSAAVQALGSRPTDYGAWPGDGADMNGAFDPRLQAAGTALRLGLAVPTTGLMANWVVINVPLAAAYSGAAVAVEARTAGGAPGYGNVVFSPQTATPVGTANAREWTSDPLLRGFTVNNTVAPSLDNPADDPPIEAASFDFPDLSTPYFNQDLVGAAQLADGAATRQQAYLLTQSLAVTSVTNEFVTDPSILAKTDWTFSMPTRRYNVAFDYEFESGGVRGRRVFTDLTLDDIDVAVPLAGSNYFTPANTSVVAKQICVLNISLTSPAGVTNRYTGASTADREERFVTTPTEFVISPGAPAAPLTFCGEVSVLSFNAGTQASVLGAAVARKDVTVPYTDGWVRIATPGLGGIGLPITGTAMMQLTNNAAAPGVSGNYGLTFPHRPTRP